MKLFQFFFFFLFFLTFSTGIYADELDCSDYSNCETGLTGSSTPLSTYGNYAYKSETDHFVYFTRKFSRAIDLATEDQFNTLTSQFECGYRYFVCAQGFSPPSSEKIQVYIGDEGSSSSYDGTITFNENYFTNSYFDYEFYTVPVHEFFHQLEYRDYSSSDENLQEGLAVLAEQLVSKENFDLSIANTSESKRLYTLEHPEINDPYQKNVFLRYVFEQLGGPFSEESWEESTNRSITGLQELFAALGGTEVYDIQTAIDALLASSVTSDSLVTSRSQAETNYMIAQYAFRYVDVATQPQYTFLVASDFASQTTLSFFSEENEAANGVSLNFSNTASAYLGDTDLGSYSPYGFLYYLGGEYDQLNIADDVDRLTFTKNAGDDDIKFLLIQRDSNNQITATELFNGTTEETVDLSNAVCNPESVFVAYTTNANPLVNDTGRLFDVTLSSEDTDGETRAGLGSTWYRDQDGDGFGDAATTTVGCAQPIGYVADSSDCDDTNSAVNPSTTETCDSMDNNCNGQIDEGATSIYYKDRDRDHFGDSSRSIQACSPPRGYVVNSADCDDRLKAVHPGATEICGNGYDENCDGVDSGC